MSFLEFIFFLGFQVCAKSQFSLFGTFSIGKRSISKRDDPMVTCLQCCDGDLCNKALCGAGNQK